MSDLTYSVEAIPRPWKKEWDRETNDMVARIARKYIAIKLFKSKQIWCAYEEPDRQNTGGIYHHSKDLIEC